MFADAGPDLSGLLGGTFYLDFCGSTFDDVSLCDFTQPYLQQNFTIEWAVGNSSLGFSTDKSPFEVDTAALSNLFDSAGSYLVTLKVIYVGGILPLSSDDNMLLTLNNPVIIPAPAALAVFVIGLGGVGFSAFVRRHRK